MPVGVVDVVKDFGGHHEGSKEQALHIGLGEMNRGARRSLDPMQVDERNDDVAWRSV